MFSPGIFAMRILAVSLAVTDSKFVGVVIFATLRSCSLTTRSGNHFSRAEKSKSGLTGLAIKSFMPASRQARRSSVKALAVKAIMGVVAHSGKSRIILVASSPDILGICISIRIRS